jgi:hypothetical protein
MCKVHLKFVCPGGGVHRKTRDILSRTGTDFAEANLLPHSKSLFAALDLLAT